MWGDRAVGDINYSSVQTWVSQLGSGDAKTAHGAGPRSATVFIRAYGVLAAILDAALRDHRISSNPARGVSLPLKVKKPHISLTHNQVSLLAEHAGDKSTLLLTLVTTGLRWGEDRWPASARSQPRSASAECARERGSRWRQDPGWDAQDARGEICAVPGAVDGASREGC